MLQASVQPTFTPEDLTDRERQSICGALGISPAPAPPSLFEDHLFLCGYTPEATWAALAKTTDVRVMIAAAALRGRVTRLPPDPRLNPLPLPTSVVQPGPHTAADAKSRGQAAPRLNGRQRSDFRTPNGKPLHTQLTSVLTYAAPNPKKPGSGTWQRYQNYVPGRTVAELLAAGITRGDIAWDVSRGFVTFAPPDPEPTPDAPATPAT
jgi:hypothetical protein